MKTSTLMFEKFKSEIVLAGANRVFDSQKSTTRRVIWALITTGLLALTTYLLADRIVYWLGDPIVVDIEITEEEHLLFPAITVCQNFPKASNMNIYAKNSSELAESLFRTLRKQFSNTEDDNTTDFSQAQLKQIDWRHFMNHMRPPISFEINKAGRNPTGCMFIERLTSGKGYSCNETVFKTTENHDLDLTTAFRMNCYTMSHQLTTGDGFLYIRLNETNRGTKVKYYLVVHQPEESPQLYVDGVRLEANKKYVIKFKRRDVLLDKHRCVSSQRRLRYFDKYSLRKCKTECYMNYTLNNPKYACYFPLGVQHFSPSRICLPQKWKSLYKQSSEDFHNAHGLNDCKCESICSQTQYTLDIDVHLNRATGNTSNKAIVVYLKHKSNQVEKIKQKETVTFFGTLAQVGGLLALFAGMRLVSFIEVADIIITSCWEANKSTDKKRQKSNAKKDIHKWEEARKLLGEDKSLIIKNVLCKRCQAEIHDDDTVTNRYNHMNGDTKKTNDLLRFMHVSSEDNRPISYAPMNSDDNSLIETQV